jgi:signal transduction histidine kinase
MTPTEWAVVAVIWLLLALSSVVTLGERATEAGFTVAVRDFVILQTGDWVGWMLLAWPLFRLFDAAPVVPPVRVRNLFLRGVILVGAAAAHTIVTYPALRAATTTLGLSDAVWRMRTNTMSGMFIGDLVNLITPVIFYAILRRTHRRRLELVRAADLERSLLASRLHALDLELRPHFLFNTLNTIVGLVKSEPDQAVRMLVTLSDLLRVTLGQSGDEVSLRDELDQLDLYVDIQRIRFGDRLDVNVTVDADVLDASVPAMLLQPLVENAITHGLATKTTKGTVAIQALRDGSSVIVSVSDDGVGLSGEGVREGTGTRNTRERLDAVYGEAASFELRARPGGGAEAIARFPYRACVSPGTTGPRRIHQLVK